MEQDRKQIEKQSKKQITRGAAISYLALLVNIAFSLFYYPWMLSKIGESNYGLYNLAISLISLFMFDFGLSTAVSRFVAKYTAEHQQDLADEFIGAVYKIYFAIDLLLTVILIVLYFFLDQIYAGLTAEELQVFRRLYIIVAGFILISYPAIPLSGIISAYEKFSALKSTELVNRFLSGILVVIALALNAGVEALVFTYAFTGIAVIAIKLWIVLKLTPARPTLRIRHRDIYRNVLTFSLWTLIINLANRIMTSSVPSILAMTSSSSAVAVFSPASAIEGYYFGIANAINGLFLPKISRIISDGEDEKLLPLMTKVGRYQAGVLGLILVGLFCIGDDFMVLWMGEGFRVSYVCLLLLCIPSFFRYTQQIGNTAIIAKGYVKEQAILVSVATGLGIVLCYFMAKRWGAVGSSAAVCIVGMIKVIGLNWIHRKKIGIDVVRFYRDCYGKMGLCFLLTAAAGRCFSLLTGQRGIAWMIVKGIVIVVIYAGLLWFTALNRDEKDAALAFLKKRVPVGKK